MHYQGTSSPWGCLYVYTWLEIKLSNHVCDSHMSVRDLLNVHGVGRAAVPVASHYFAKTGVYEDFCSPLHMYRITPVTSRSIDAFMSCYSSLMC